MASFQLPTSVQQNRRRFERFELPCMYTGVGVRTLDSEAFDREGHAYNVSEGGVQFELDYGIAPGTPVALRIDLPPSVLVAGDIGPGRSVFVLGNVVWLDDTDGPGPVRMAMAITRFARAGDRDRLMRIFSAGKLRRAA
jgi:hypothetical protein